MAVDRRLVEGHDGLEVTGSTNSNKIHEPIYMTFGGLFFHKSLFSKINGRHEITEKSCHTESRKEKYVTIKRKSRRTEFK